VLVTRKTPFLTLAALVVFFFVMVAIEGAAASGDDGDGHGGPGKSEYGVVLQGGRS
jgi:hypothetical protein